MIEADGGGLRFNEGKPRYDLLPPEALDALAAHMMVGARKYAERNWERGMSWGHCFAGVMRHSWAFWRGENYDEETGTHHMIAAMWNCMALFVYFTRKIGEDTRHVLKTSDASEAVYGESSLEDVAGRLA